MTIEKFTPESVIIHRTDTGNYPIDGRMTGRMESGNNSATGNGWKITWGDALDTIPGSGLNTMQGNGQQQSGQITLKDFVDFTDFVKALAWWGDRLTGSR
jgi:hypothetical protein